MLWLQTNKQSSGTMNLGGSLTRQIEADNVVTDSASHIVNIGRMVEVLFWLLKILTISNIFTILNKNTGHGEQDPKHPQ